MHAPCPIHTDPDWDRWDDMQMDEVRQLKAKWQKMLEGDPSLVCDHPNYVREFYLGSHTDDRVCTRCGAYRP